MHRAWRRNSGGAWWTRDTAALRICILQISWSSCFALEVWERVDKQEVRKESESKNGAQCAAPFQIRHITQLRQQHVLKSLKYYNSDQLKLQQSMFRDMKSITIIDEDRNLPWRCPTFNACIALTLQTHGTFKSALKCINTLFSLLAWGLCSAGWIKEPLQFSCSLLQRQLPI